mgnify:CR=1 FL=1
MKVPDAVGVPLIVIVFGAQAAVTPAGNPVGVPMLVAPVVVWVMLVIKVLIHGVGEDEAADTVFVGVIVTVKAALLALTQPVVLFFTVIVPL